MTNRALFLDRDGTIIHDRGYMRHASDVQLLPGAAEALRTIGAEGWKLIVVSNQAGVATGLIRPGESEDVQGRFLELMHAEGVNITESYFCFHAQDAGCECRKPSPWFLRKAAEQYEIDLSASFMMGDRESDIRCGLNAGCKTIWLRNESFTVDPMLPDFVANGWDEVAGFMRPRTPGLQ